MKVRFLAVARDELKEAVRFYNAQRPGLGREFREEVQNAVKRIQSYPEAWSSLGDGFRRCLVSRFPYGLIYVVGEEEILIVAIAHLHREPDYWNQRTGRS